jgi:hypothetical protein
MENDTARLFSPVYTSQSTESQPSCFIFWYHMFGATTGMWIPEWCFEACIDDSQPLKINLM